MRLIQEGEEAEGTEAEHFREVEVGERASGNKGGEILRKGVPGRKYGESSSCYRWKYKMTHPFSKAICQYALEMFRAFDPAVPVFEISLRKASRALLYLSPLESLSNSLTSHSVLLLCVISQPTACPLLPWLLFHQTPCCRPSVHSCTLGHETASV